MSGFFNEDEETPSDTAQVEGGKPRGFGPRPGEQIQYPGGSPHFYDPPQRLVPPGGEPIMGRPVTPPDEGGGFFQGLHGQRPVTADPFSVGSSGDDSEGDASMAGIEAVGEGRSAHQQQRDKTYDAIGKVGKAVGLASGAADVIYPGSGSVMRGVGAAISGAAVAGRVVGAIIDDGYDRDDQNRHEQTQRDIARMKDQAARDKINKNTPRGHNKITED